MEGVGNLYLMGGCTLPSGHRGGGGRTQKKKMKMSQPDSISCAWLHMGLNDDPGGWWGAVGEGSGGGSTCSDSGGGLVLLVLTWYLFFP